MKALKKLEEFKKEFTALEKKEMMNVKGGLTKSWTENTCTNGCEDKDSMAQDYRWNGSSWEKWGPAYRKSTCLVDASCGQ